jgi:hypothetical protein
MRKSSWLFWALLLTGCGGSGSVNGPPPPPTAGAFQESWHATVVSQTGSSFTNFDVFITQNGSSVQSQQVLLNQICGQQGTMAGSSTATSLTMTITLNTSPTNTDTILVNGTLSGAAITGTYATSGPCVGGDHGTFSAEMIPSISNSQWSGSISSGTGQDAMMGSITEETSTGNLTANFTFGTGFCITQVSMTGNLVGNAILMGSSSGALSLNGNVDSQGKIMSGNYTDSCQFGVFDISHP